MPIEEVLDRVKAVGITLTYSSETEKLVAKPTSAVTPEIIAALRECREEIINTLNSPTIQSVVEVFELARETFPDREDLPILPSPPGTDPMVVRDTDKVKFFQGNWRKASPRNIRPTT